MMYSRFVRGVVVITLFAALDFVSAQHAVHVLSYDEGSTAAASFNVANAAVGRPERFTGEGSDFSGAVTPFNPPFLATEIVSVGEGGHLTLRLSHFVIPQSDGPEIGVFTNSGLIDVDWPNGIVGDPVGFFGNESAEFDVSADGENWVSLGRTLFDVPTAGYRDAAQTMESDFQQPFSGSASDFAGLPLSDSNETDILGTLNGSGGGTWLDISDSGLAEVGYVRFRVEDDGDSSSLLNFELDAVSIASGAMGVATVPEPTLAWWIIVPALMLMRRRVFLPS